MDVVDQALFDAVINEDFHKASRCLAKGANPNRIFVDQGGVSPFHIAVGLEDDRKFTELFLAYGANVNLKSLEKDWTPVHVCAYWNKHESMRLLLSHKANPLQLDLDGKCALDIAAQHENRECLDVMRGFLRRKQDESASLRSSYRKPSTDYQQDDFSHFYSNSDVKLKRSMSRTRTQTEEYEELRKSPLYQTLDTSSLSSFKTSTFNESHFTNSASQPVSGKDQPPLTRVEHEYMNAETICAGRGYSGSSVVSSTIPQSSSSQVTVIENKKRPSTQVQINMSDLENVISNLIDMKIGQKQQRQSVSTVTQSLTAVSPATPTDRSNFDFKSTSIPRPRKPRAPLPPSASKTAASTQTKITNCRFRSPDRLPQFYNKEESTWSPQKSVNSASFSPSLSSNPNEKETQTSGRLVTLKASELKSEPIPAEQVSIVRQSRVQERPARTGQRCQSMDGGLNSRKLVQKQSQDNQANVQQSNANIYNRFKTWMNKLNVPILNVSAEKYPYPVQQPSADNPKTSSLRHRTSSEKNFQLSETMDIKSSLPTKVSTPVKSQVRLNESAISQGNNTTRNFKEASFTTNMNDLITDRIGKDFFNHVLGKDRIKSIPTPFKSTPKVSRIQSVPVSTAGAVNFCLESEDEDKPIVEVSTREVIQNSRKDHSIVTTWAIHTNELGNLETTLIDREEDLVFRETLISTDQSAVFGDPKNESSRSTLYKTAIEDGFESDALTNDQSVEEMEQTFTIPDKTLTPTTSSLVNSSRRSVQKDVSTLKDDELRSELVKHGSNVGPVIASTRSVLEKRLSDLMVKSAAKENTLPPHETKSKPTPKTNKPVRKLVKEASAPQVGFSPELVEELTSRLNMTTSSDTIEQNMFTCFQQPQKVGDQMVEWREGHIKSAFNYLLIDPRISCNLPARSKHMDAKEVFRTFIRSIFYIGKGSRARPYAHLYDTLKLWKSKTQADGPVEIKSRKIQRIIDIWEENYGVVSLHCFQSVIPSEAYTREAAMIDAIGMHNLTNMKKGNYYGEAKDWEARKKRQLGTVLLRKACAIFIAEGERQITPVDI